MPSKFISLLAMKGDVKRLLGNIFSLAMLQLINYILPLILIPYLVIHIGIDNVGVIATASALCIYFQMISDYGFNLTATRDVAENREDHERLVEIFSAVFYIKISFLSVCFFIFLLIIKNIPIYSMSLDIYIYSYLIIVGQSLFPVWFFQGMENMKFITIINTATKIFGTILIFVMTKNSDDAFLVPLINGGASLLSCILGIIIAWRKFNMTVKLIKISVIQKYLIDGWHIFVSRVASTLYKNSNIVIMSMFSSPAVVGSYSICERVVRSVQMVQNVIGDAVFPFFNNKNKNDSDYIKRFFKKYGKKVFYFYISLTLIFILFTPVITNIFYHHQDISVIINFVIFSGVILFGGLNYFYGILGLVSIGKMKEFSKNVIIVGVTNIVVCVILSITFSNYAGAISATLSEFLLLSLIMRSFYKSIKD
ncbi:oligosaccharide flippase family protein [Hafnia alvei]|uniref:oligosaccharide flippase family protein n=1 Tax=Hafnia alvei TaxID=569 RepID=UPI00345DE539